MCLKCTYIAIRGGLAFTMVYVALSRITSSLEVTLNCRGLVVSAASGRIFSSLRRLTVSARATCHMQTSGENPLTRSNRPPTSDILPKWVSRLCFVLPWPVEVIS